MVKERDYLVYDRLIIPVGLHYYGITYNLNHRTQYKTTSLQQYINEYGWDNISTTIVAEGLTKKEAELFEDKLIKEGWLRGDCINKVGSGGYERDNRKEYQKRKNKEYYDEHKSEISVYKKKYIKEHLEKYRNMRKKCYQNHINEYQEKGRKNSKRQRSTPEGKIYDRVHAFNQRHPDKIIETPLEAKKKYLEWGYIPSYIKNDDLNADIIT